jgi:hypothetical protein
VFSLTATSPSGAGAFAGGLRLAPGAPLARLRLELGAQRFTVRGVVKDRAGRAFTLARVLAARLGPDAGDLFVTFADARGRYELALTPAPHLLFGEGDGYASRQPERAAPGAPATVDLVLDPVRR